MIVVGNAGCQDRHLGMRCYPKVEQNFRYLGAKAASFTDIFALFGCSEFEWKSILCPLPLQGSQALKALGLKKGWLQKQQ